MSDSFPVYVTVRRDDGRSEQVRIGTATKAGDGFSVQFDALTIGAEPMAARAAPQRAAPSHSGGGGGDGAVFPPYGRSKGQPVYGASRQDLEFYANGSRRSLNDPSKSRWHDKERVLLASIEAEIARQEGGGGSEDFSGGAGPDDSHIPPPGDEDAPF